MCERACWTWPAFRAIATLPAAAAEFPVDPGLHDDGLHLHGLRARPPDRDRARTGRAGEDRIERGNPDQYFIIRTRQDESHLAARAQRVTADALITRAAAQAASGLGGRLFLGQRLFDFLEVPTGPVR